MATKPIKKSVLFRTSAATDVQYAGGDIIIGGLNVVSRKDVTSIKQIKSRAEVAQVVTVTTTAAPTGSTTYKVFVYDPLREQAGYQESPKPYSYTTTATLVLEGATAALQREYINAQIIADINADASNHAVAVTLAGGTGFTITDDGSYCPVFAQNMSNVRGVNTVYAVPNGDGTGFPTTVVSTTTTGVYSFGLGTNLLAEKPVVDFVYGNLISGVLDDAPVTLANPPLGAVSGQNYDCFAIESMKAVDAIQATGQFAYVESIQRVFADNGTGTSTTNLTGFKAVERVFHKLMVSTYAADANCVQEWFDKPIVFQDALGAAPAGTADTLGWMESPYGSLNKTNIGAQTIVAPVLDATGLLIDQDDTDTKGAHYSAYQGALGDQSFIVGKTAAMVAARVVMGDYTDAAFILGFRKKEAYNAVFNAYTDYATIGNGSSAAGTTYINGDLFVTRAELNGGGILQTVSAVAPADGVSYLCWVKVDIDGYVTAFVNGTSYPIYSAGTTQMKFDATDELIPCFQITNIASGNPACSIGEFFAVATDKLIS